MGSRQPPSFADHWEYVGVAVEEPGFTVWGTSPIRGDDGRVHLFAARWPGHLGVDPGWRSHSEIAHYVGEGPEGPFRFVDVALRGTGKATWDRYGAHNPAIHRVGDRFVLLYIGNDDPTPPAHPGNQRIGMAVSDGLDGPWRRVGRDGCILAPPADPARWNHAASCGVNNPALLAHPGGGFFLYFKSHESRMGVAVAETIDGPWVQLPFPVTDNERPVEDGYAFVMDGRICLLTTDNHGLLQTGGGILWSSADGITFDRREPGFHPVDRYLGADRLRHAACHYGPPVVKLERPQVLLRDGRPAYLYAASGHHFTGGASPASHVLRFTG